MLLITLTFDNDNSDSVTRYISDEYRDLTNHFWDAFVFSAPSISYALNKPYGGRVIVSVGDIDLIPTVFDNQGTETGDTWPPPISMDILVEYGDDDDGAGDKIKLFEGTAHRTRIDRSSIGYELYANDPTFTVRSLKIEQDLESIFDDFVAMWTPDYTLVTTYASGASAIDVELITPDTQMLFVDILADICECYGYFFYIDHVEEEVHLVSMDTSNGASTEITEFDFFPSRYTDPVPIKYITIGETKIAGDYVYGEEIDFSNICAESPFIRIGDNSGNDGLWIVHNGNEDVDGVPNFIRYDFFNNKMYRYTLEYRKVSGTHAIYGGFHCMDDLTTSLNTAGADAASAQHYIFSRSGVADNDWHTVTGYMSGLMPGAGDTGGSNVGSDGTTISGTIPYLKARQIASYIRPLIAVNYNGAAGITDIRYCAIHEVKFDITNHESDGEVVKTLFELKADHFDPDAWEFFVGSSALVSSPMQDAIDNIIAISKKPTVELRMPLVKDYIYSMGQEITWTDESQHQAVDAAIKIRSMNFDFNADEVVAVGEGTLVNVPDVVKYLADGSDYLVDGTDKLKDGV